MALFITTRTWQCYWHMRYILYSYPFSFQQMAHLIARHGVERASLKMTTFGLCNLFADSTSQKHEYEADKIGLHLVASAGYDPTGCIFFLNRLLTKSETKGGSHPFLRKIYFRDHL